MNLNPQTDRKPVIALMGEFSAGKSTLANLLICQGRSPVKVTATQLPPVWYSYGTDTPVVVDLDGNETPITEEEMHLVPVETTLYIRAQLDADILELMDLIDMPGNSDPNMSPEVWGRALHNADAVIWCTHATQAWRQSEAAVWDELPPHLTDRSLLLLTRYDKLLTESDRARVLARVKKETRGQFRGIFPISLLEALEAGEDHDRWIASGAEDFVQSLLDIVLELDGVPPTTIAPVEVSAKRPERPREEPVAPVDDGAIAPRRVAAKSSTPRPPRREAV